jgi:hypothetical protein
MMSVAQEGGLDVIPAITATEEREVFLSFTDAYLSRF